MKKIQEKVCLSIMGLGLLIPALSLLAAWQPGLKAGYIGSAWNTSGYPTTTGPQLGPHSGATSSTTVWADNRTWVYTGQIYLNGATYHFAENIDNNAMLKIDGVTYINNTQLDIPTKSGPITLPAGWHTIEIRFGNSVNTGGATQTFGWTHTKGFGYNIGGADTTDGGDYIFPWDDGNMTLFRYEDGAAGVRNEMAGDVTSTTASFNGTLQSALSNQVAVYWGPTDGGSSPAAWSNRVDFAYPATAGLFSTNVAIVSDSLSFYRYYMSNDVLNAWAPTSESVLSGAVTVQVIDNEATEGLADPGVFRVSRPESATNGALTVYFALGGSAVNSRDYAAVGGSIVIPEGQASVDVEIAPIEDLDLAEGDETVTLTLAPGSYIIGTPSSVNLTVHDSGALDQFAHRSPFVFTGHRSAETLTNFPALVLLGTNVNDFSYSDLLSGKYNDLRFTDESMTGFLNYEVESWTTNSLSQIWVQVPALTNGTTIWAHWGQSGMTAPAYTTNGATWANNYLAVYHLAETSGPVRDSSPYGNGLSLNGDIQQGTAGYVGAAATWPDTSNDWLQRPVNDSLQGMGQLTLQTWFYDQQNDISARGLISKRSSQTSQVSYYLFKYQNKNLWCFLNNNPSTGGGEFTNTVTGANSWNLAAFTYDRNLGTSRMKAYLNGDYRSSRNDVSGNVPITTSALHIGILNANYGSCFKGRMDEVRISSTARSAEWIKAEYLNMSSNSLFQIYPGPMPSLFVDSYPQQYAGAVPSYGSTNLIGGEVFSCTVPEFVDVDVGVRYACAGYLLYSNLVELARSDTVNSCIYTNSGGADRLIWQWKPQSYVTFTNSGPGTVSIPGGWYDVGAQVACTAVVGGAAQFIGWDDPQGLLLTPPAFSNSLAGVIQPAILTATFISSFNSAGWPNRMSIRFDGYDKSETLTNFPVMVTFSNTLAGCFYYADMASPADAGDLRFTAGDGTTELFYDIEKWNTNGTSTLWVRLPQLSADNNRIFAFWGNPAQVEPPLYTGNGLTWANGFVAVYHLAEESGAVKDSSPYGNGLTVYNNVQQGVNGIVGPSARWPIAGTDWMEGPASDSLQGMGELTLQTWFYDELSDGEARGLISKRQDINTDRSYYLFKYQNNNLWWYIGGSGGQFSNTATTANRWYFASATYDKNLSSGRMKIYLDGEFRSSSSYASGDVPVFDSTLCLGMLNANYTRSFNGQMDEVRISRAARSPDWIWAEYMNVKNSDLFQSYARSSVGTIIVVR